MDTGSLALLIPIAAITAGATIKIAKIYAGARTQNAGGDSLARLDGLENEVTELRRELTEAQERLDFAERLLAQGQRPDRLDQLPRQG